MNSLMCGGCGATGVSQWAFFLSARPEAQPKADGNASKATTLPPDEGGSVMTSTPLGDYINPRCKWAPGMN